MLIVVGILDPVDQHNHQNYDNRNYGDNTKRRRSKQADSRGKASYRRHSTRRNGSYQCEDTESRYNAADRH